MSPTYMTCPECGKRALNVATRCPQCGFEFPARPVRDGTPALGRLVPLLAVAGVVVALVALANTVLRRTAERAEPPVSAAAPELDTAMAATPPASPMERRFARTWTNVRSRRSTSGEVVAVLLPGDTVLADSLERGWWRVTFEGEVLGYVYRSTLVPEPPPAADSLP
jgi:hypothetical protein